MDKFNLRKQAISYTGLFGCARFFELAADFLCVVILSKLGLVYVAASGLITAFKGFTLVTARVSLYSVGMFAVKSFGQGQYESVGAWYRSGLWFALILSIVVVFILMCVGPILMVIQGSFSITLLLQEFFKVFVWSVPALLFQVVNQQFLFSIFKPGWVIKINVLQSLLILASTYCFVLKTSLGIVGLAYAYVITYWLVFLSTQVFIAWHPYLKKFQLSTQSRLLNLYKLKGLLREGSYMGMMACSEVAGFTVLMVLVGYLGHIALASAEAASQYLWIISIPVAIMSQGSAMLIGHKIGETVNLSHSTFHEVRYISKAITFFSMCIPVIFLFCTLLYPEALALIFLSPTDYAAIKLVEKLLLIIALTQFFDVLRFVGAGSLRALKDNKFAALASLLFILILASILSWFFGCYLMYGVVVMFLIRALMIGITGLLVQARWIKLTRNRLVC